MTLSFAKKLGLSAATAFVACLVLGVAIFALDRLRPRRDPLPVELARKDEKAAASAAQAIGAATEARNRDANINIDLVTKDIRDAFDAIPVVPVPIGANPRPLPAAPVDRVRDRLNESVARANRAAELPARPTDLTRTERLKPLTAAPRSGDEVTISRNGLEEVYERLAEAIGAVERGNNRISGNNRLWACTAANWQTGSAPTSCR